MSREPKRMEENVRGSSRLIIYIAVAAAIAIVIISYVIIANMLEGKREKERLAKLEEQEKQNYEQQSLEIEFGNIEDEEDAESVSTQMGKTVEESSKEDQTSKVSNSTNTTIQKIDNTTKKENTTTQKNTEKKANEVNKNEAGSNEAKTEEETKKEITFAMPVDGEIVRGFAKDSLVYSETLQEWIVHQAIDIKANSRDVVKAAADGSVKAIKNDPRYGLTVIIEHEGGFKTVYSNLLTAEFVVEGENIKQGQTLGTVGSSATFEIADEPHLHFEMLQDSVYVDPTIYIKQ